MGNYCEYLHICDDYEILLRTAVNYKMAKIHKIVLRAAVLATLLWTAACSPEVNFVDRDAVLRFSEDTVFLDTVFAQVGSSTRSVRVINPTSDNLRIKRIELAGGASSPFRINVNGNAGPSVEDVELAAGDSLWIFVEVTAPPQGAQFLYTDSIVVQTGTVRQDIDLVTLALDAEKSEKLPKNQCPAQTGRSFGPYKGCQPGLRPLALTGSATFSVTRSFLTTALSNWLTRDSVTPSTSPISFRLSSST